MNCINCYQDVPKGAKFCPHCGAKQLEYDQQPEYNHQPEYNQQPEGQVKSEETVLSGAASQSEPTAKPESVSQSEPTAELGSTGQSETTGQQDAGERQHGSDNTYGQYYQNNNAYQSGAAYQSGTAYQNGGYGNGYQTPPEYQGMYQSGNQQKPINWVPYLVLSIVSTICCCNLFSAGFGIVGIVYSTKINSAVNAGDYQGAEDAAKKARIWIIVAFAVGVIGNIIGFLLLQMAGWGYWYY